MDAGQIQQLKVQVRSASEKARDGQILLKVYSRQERTKRALMALFGFWLLALLSVLIPVAHFVLVPTFFILGPYMAHVRWNQDAGIVGGECICPECNEKLKLGSLKADWPLRQSCLNCKSSLRIEKI